tara:strand:- start:5434 stop:5883 length:450 start_codon:yes stop_codon:yes gene_type:complete
VILLKAIENILTLCKVIELKIMKIAHLGIVVRSIDKALPLWEIALKGEVSYRKAYERENAEIAMLKVGNVNIELLEPIGEGVLKRFLDKRGEGFHHIAFRVSDLNKAEKKFNSLGFETIESSRQDGVNGGGALFFNPKFTMGILMEIIS